MRILFQRNDVDFIHFVSVIFNRIYHYWKIPFQNFFDFLIDFYTPCRLQRSKAEGHWMLQKTRRCISKIHYAQAFSLSKPRSIPSKKVIIILGISFLYFQKFSLSANYMLRHTKSQISGSFILLIHCIFNMMPSEIFFTNNWYLSFRHRRIFLNLVRVRQLS